MIKIIVFILFFSTSCLSKNNQQTETSNNNKTELGSHKVSIMTFNVENLFDTKHDKGKKDYTFLPKSYKSQKKHIKGCNKIRRKKWKDQCLYWDWSETVLDEKMNRLKNSIQQVNNGLGPDIIVLQEVENIRVLESFRKKYLKGMGYKKSILIEGRDIRGIDVAFISKLETKGRPTLTMVPFESVSKRRKADTRGILRQDFKLPNGDILTGYAAHFPAPYHPYKLRVQSYKFLNSLLDKLPKNQLAFAAGDFNTPTKENNKYKIIDKYVRTHWSVPHQTHCDGCLGTNYYAPKKSWSFLDMILLSKSFSSSKLKLKKVFIANKTDHQTTAKSRPNSFKLQGDKIYGVSDHWPMVVELSSAQ